MASPAVKQRKIDPNARQNKNGYPIELFTHQTVADKYLCVICQGVYKQPYHIKCDNEHIFCKACLDNYFIFAPTNSTKSCPSCQCQGLSKNNIKPSRHAERVVNSLNIKCPLQLKQNEHSNIPFHAVCRWTGELNDLTKHENICQLANVICDHCLQNMKRYELTAHDKNCPEKRVSCDLCAQEIKRRLMQSHQNNKCSMKMLSCDECKENVLRKNMGKHILKYCPEYEIMCRFNQYGCNIRIKRKLINNHLKENEIEHWKMKVNAIEKKLDAVKQEHTTKFKQMNEENKTQSERLKKTIEDQSKELAKVKQANKTLRTETKEQEMRIQTLETLKLNDKHKLLLLLQSNDAYITGVQSGKKQQVEIRNFMNKHDRYCMGNGIGFSATKQIGFDGKDVNLIRNDVVFGLSENRNTISAVNINNKICKTFNGDLSIRGYVPIYCHGHGLMIVGGESAHYDTRRVANKDIYQIKFDDNKFTKETMTKLPYSTIHPSVCMINDNNKLFVCGGLGDTIYGDMNLSECYSYSFKYDTWKELKSMNYEHQCGGICVWKERGNKIIVAGGHTNGSTNKKVEEYDMQKNKWINLPNLKKKHEYYPALLTSNNVLFCVGGVYHGDNNLGSIELYDPRDRSKGWIYVDTVQNYFNIAQDTGAGYNCFLPL